MLLHTYILGWIEHYAGLLLLLCVAGIVLACLSPFNFFTPNHVTGFAGGGVEFKDPSIAYTSDTVTKLAGVERFTMSLHIIPSYHPFNPSIGQIIGSGVDSKRSNFSLRQRSQELCLMIGADSGDYPQCIFLVQEIFVKPDILWIDLVFDGSMLRSYVNGIAHDSVRYDVPLHWSGSYPILAGNSPDLLHPWSGRIESFALFSEVLSPESRGGGWRTQPWFKPLLLYRTYDTTRSIITDDGTGKAADLIVPENYRPYQRIYFEPFSCFCPWDIVINIIGFVPLGFFLSLLFRRTGLGALKGMILTLVLGSLMSFMMELFQAYLPTRGSQISDIVYNSVGTVPGYYLCKILYYKFLPRA